MLIVRQIEITNFQVGYVGKSKWMFEQTRQPHAKCSCVSITNLSSKILM